jgi:hypothetical protein
VYVFRLCRSRSYARILEDFFGNGWHGQFDLLNHTLHTLVTRGWIVKRHPERASSNESKPLGCLPFFLHQHWNDRNLPLLRVLQFQFLCVKTASALVRSNAV